MVSVLSFLISAFLWQRIWATCNPLSTTCSADRALATSFIEDFDSKSNYFSEISSKGVQFTDDGLTLTISEKGDNPSLKSQFYIMFGRVELVAKAANGTGIISTVYLQSDDLDEIDWEMFGSDPYEVGSNFFSKGNTSTYDRGGYHKTSSSPYENYHTYGIDWTEESLTWYIDGEPVRVLSNDSSDGYPQTPMALYMGVWAGGDSSNAAGTIEWAGGTTDYSDGPFTGYIKSIIVTDYSSGTQYSYGDKSGDWTSINSKGGSINARYDEGQEEFSSLASKASTLYTETYTEGATNVETYATAATITADYTETTTTGKDSETTTTSKKNVVQTWAETTIDTSTPYLSIIIQPTTTIYDTNGHTKTTETPTGTQNTYETYTTWNTYNTYDTYTTGVSTYSENPARSYFTTSLTYNTNPVRSYFTSATASTDNPILSTRSDGGSGTYQNDALSSKYFISTYYCLLIPLIIFANMLI